MDLEAVAGEMAQQAFGQLATGVVAGEDEEDALHRCAMIAPTSMPRISEFFGIVVRMFYNDHLPAHFHADYGGSEAVYAVETLDVLRGRLPRRAHALVVEWATLRRSELRADWDKAREGLALDDIEPLD